MRGPVDGLLEEAASVYRLVEFIERFCVEQKTNRSYVPATSQFLKAVSLLAKGTKKHLQHLAVEAAKRTASGSPLFESWLNNERGSLRTIKGSWTILHKYLKPAADAHALQVPFSLVTLAERQLQPMPPVQGALIAVLLTPELNYFQRSHTSLKRTINTLMETTSQTGVPVGLIGFVELPFSQGPSLFSNVLLYHELGHFVLAEKVSVTERLAQAAGESLGEVYGTKFTSQAKPTQAIATRILQTWAQEIFCDLFAIRLTGPAFAFASIEMFGLLGLLAEDTQKRFIQSHPAPACRFRQQLKMLKDDGWWPIVSQLDSDRRIQLERFAAVSEEDYWLSLNESRVPDTGLVRAFINMLKTVETLVKETTIEPIDARQCFADERPHIEDCLENGIVPSRLFAGRHLSLALPVAIVNSAFCFYLSEKMPQLISTLVDQDPSNLDHRSYWTKRLEMWTVKAIEDYFLLDGAQNYGRSATRGVEIPAPKGAYESTELGHNTSARPDRGV